MVLKARPRTSRRLLRRSIQSLADETRRLAETADGGVLKSFANCCRDELGEDVAGETAAEDFALTAACLAVVTYPLRTARGGRMSDFVAFACRHPLCRIVWDAVEASRKQSHSAAMARVVSAAEVVAKHTADDGPAHIVEHLLSEFHPQRRRATGVYYTPSAVVSYLVERTDQVLRDELKRPGGLAPMNNSPPLHIIDPAMGSGLFLLEAVRRVRQSWRPKSTNGNRDDWNEYLSTQLLPQMHGLEIMPAALIVAHFLLADALIESGFVAQPHDRLRMQLCDTMKQQHLFADEADTVIILGNPPYRGLSAGGHDWIVRLMHGDDEGRVCASYYHANGEALGERKHWLHDDYVKFFRWGQWQIERAGEGVLALVTNHGYLDNPTFRGMRSGLMETFCSIELVDLQGNAKKGAGDRDESVFETAQGMATTVAWKSCESNETSEVRRVDLQGSRETKLNALRGFAETQQPLEQIHPQPPHFFFCAHDSRLDEEYAEFYSINEVMPMSTTAAVTARDSFVIDIDRESLVERLSLFRDLRVSDDEIRERYFNNSRSAKYPPGDTRGWKLPAARRRLAEESDWQRHIRTCWYRPGDRRWIFWTPWMIDWPRQEVMRHMHAGNVALVCRRQMLRGQPCNFFWVADDIVIDGYIRSDNRGSESIFPLWDRSPDLSEPRLQGTANFTPAVLCAVETKLNRKFKQYPAARSRYEHFHAHDLLHYIYAIFHCPTYRKRYAEQLRIDFPRFPLPNSPETFWKLASHGEELVRLHLLQGESAKFESHETESLTVAPGWPKFSDGRVFTSAVQSMGPIERAAWEFRVGAHQVLCKWLKDRRGRTLSEADMQTYCQLADAVTRTVDAMKEIDNRVHQEGGWAAAFTA